MSLSTCPLRDRPSPFVSLLLVLRPPTAESVFLVTCGAHTVLCGGECFICCNFCLRVLCCRHIYCSCRPAIERRHAVALSIRRAKTQKISPEVALARLLASNDDVPEEVLLRRLTAGARSAAASPYGSDAPASFPSI